MRERIEVKKGIDEERKKKLAKRKSKEKKTDKNKVSRRK